MIQETLRLYTPLPYLVREALEDINVGNINIPKGVTIEVPIHILHQHEDLRGLDAHQFKPDRFANGTAGACKVPQVYMHLDLECASGRTTLRNGRTEGSSVSHSVKV